MQAKELLKYLQRAAHELNAAGRFANGLPFWPSQQEALSAFETHVNNPELPTEEKIRGYFQIATGLGKTPLFLAITDKVAELALRDGKPFRAVTKVPMRELLSQAEKEIQKFAPTLARGTGVYGDSKKNIGEINMLTTYQGWIEASDLNLINPEMLSMEITDEGQYNLSDPRVDLLGRYSGHVAQFGFSAWSAYDEQKTMERTHGTKIYAKNIMDGVLGGELTSYIHTQEFHIGVPYPDEGAMLNQFHKSHALDPMVYDQWRQSYLRKVMSTAWNIHMVEQYKAGFDRRAGEPLTDGFTGFYVADTWQANDLVARLNADPYLQHIAKLQKRRAVATTVHTGLIDNGLETTRRFSNSELKKRLEQFQGREYMAIAANDMIAVGWDCLFLDRIIKTMDFSLMEALQKLGRATRAYFDEGKNRWKGSTALDTLMYWIYADPNKTRQEFNDRFIRMRSVRDVLQGNMNLTGPKAPPQSPRLEFNQPRPAAPPTPRISMDGVQITAIMNDFDTYTIEQERREKRRKAEEEWSVDHEFISTENQKYLTSEAERTHLSGYSLYILYKKIQNPPEGMKSYHADKIVSGEKKHAPSSWITFLKSGYAIQVDGISKPKSKLISKKDQKHFKAEQTRTGLSGFTLYKKILTPFEGMSELDAKDIVSGRKKKAPPSWVTFLKMEYKKQASVIPQPKREPISKEDRNFFSIQTNRTKLGGHAVFKKIKNPPLGLTWKKAVKIALGEAESAVPSYVSTLKKAYLDQPDAKPQLERIVISEKEREFLQAEEKRTGLGGVAIYNRIQNPPDGMKDQHAFNILAGRLQNSPQSYINAMKVAYAEQSNKDMNNDLIVIPT
ncbi:MAG: DEAD/DEAH box helicase family protein [Alphaproteobacteria bacterium]|nr:DEAD/DEAH box helicase family protein [Alphaproteobacteria bacterium]